MNMFASLGERKALSCFCMASVLIVLLGMPAWCGCATCGGGGGGVQGVDVNTSNGATSVMPIIGDADMGPGAPGRCDANNMPGAGNVRNLGSATNPFIKWGLSRITVDTSGGVLLDGVIAPNWSWNSSTKTLKTADGRLYVFGNPEGTMTSMSGPDGLRVNTFAYQQTSPDRLASVTDSYGNAWGYTVDDSASAPTCIRNSDGSKVVHYAYKPFGTSGAGQYDKVSVYHIDFGSYSLVEEQHTDYTYNTADQLSTVVHPGVP
jgi:hypothetical protein